MTMFREFIREPSLPPATEQMYGIEVELENFMEGPTAQGWRWNSTDDGSLRNAGVEFLTPGAWDMSTCLRQIHLLYEQMAVHGWRASVRTGIHVHVNCLDYTEEQLGGILMTYCLLEPVLFRMCGPEREEGIYCVPWYRAGKEQEIACEIISGRNIRRVNNSCKYSALYLQPLLRYGTIEFRHAPTFVEEEHMVRWLRTIDYLVSYGKTRTAREVMDEFTAKGANAWAEDVFGPDMFPQIVSACEKSVEEIIDEVDAAATAEDLLPMEEDAPWTSPTLYVQGDGFRQYHRAVRGGSRPMYDLEEVPAQFYDDEDDFDIEEDY